MSEHTTPAPSPAQEQWLPVHGLHGRYGLPDGDYEVSTLGRVRRVPAGHGLQAYHLLRVKPNNRGYPCVRLYLGGSLRARVIMVHILVAHGFLGPCPEGHEVNHKDNDPANSWPSNLEYLTHSGNMLHAAAQHRLALQKHPEKVCGERNPSVRLTESQVLAVCRRHLAGASQKALAREYRVDPKSIYNIVNGFKWGHLTGRGRRT